MKPPKKGNLRQEPSGRLGRKTGGQQIGEIYGAVLNAVKGRKGLRLCGSWDYTGSIKYFSGYEPGWHRGIDRQGRNVR